MEGYDDDDMLDKFRSGGSGLGLKHFEGEATPRRPRKDVRMRTGRTLGYELGKEGRKTGVKRKPNVAKDADDLDNVEDFFDSDQEEEEEEAPPVVRKKPSRPSPKRIGERSPAQESTSDMSLVSTPASRSAFANPKKKKSKAATPSRQRRATRSPASIKAVVEEDVDDDVPAFEYDDSDMVDVDDFSAQYDDTMGGMDDYGLGTDDEDEDVTMTPVSTTSKDSRMRASEYAEMTVKELRIRCLASGIKVGKLSKKELIKLLLNAKSPSTPKKKAKASTPKQKAKASRASPRTPRYESEEEDSDEDITLGDLDLEEDDDDEIDLASFDIPNVGAWGSSRLKSELSRLGLSTSGSREELAKRLQKALVDEALSSTPRRHTGEDSPFSAKKQKQKTSRKRRRSSVDDYEEYEEPMKGEPSPDMYGKPKRLTRRPPLAFWKNEHVAYGRRRSGNFATVIDIVEREEDEEYGLAPPKKKARRAGGSTRAVVYPEAPVYNWVTGEEMPYRVVKSADMLKFSALGKSSSKAHNSAVTTSSKSAEPVSTHAEVAYAFDEGDSFTSGVLTIGPSETTPVQNTAYSMEVFYVVAGALDVTINKSTFNVKKGSHFFVPSENRFRLRNTSSRATASVVFFRTVRLEAD